MGTKQAILLKQCKQNIINGHSSHYESTSKYYFFGNRGNYDMINYSSIIKCVPKKYIGNNRMIISKQDSEYLESFTSKELNMAKEGLCKVIPSISNYISPTLSVAYNIQHDIGYYNMKQMKSSNWSL